MINKGFTLKIQDSENISIGVGKMLLQDRDETTEVRFKAGERIFTEGSLDDTIFLIARGMVRLSHGFGDDDARILQAGQIFGESDWMNLSRRLFTAVAMEDTLCYAISADSMKKQYGRTPASMQALIRSQLNAIKGLKGDHTLITAAHVKAIMAGEDPDFSDIGTAFEDIDSFDASMRDR